MILLADSGSSKTEWCLISRDGERRTFLTKGMNPFLSSPEQMSQELEETLLPQLPGTEMDELYFYGAGCAFDKIAIMEGVLRKHLQVRGALEVHPDMTGAARGLCGRQPGIACILGTGSNSCFYDGQQIVRRVPPLGYILGDEGSGSVLGRMFISDLLKNQLDGTLAADFYQTYQLNEAQIIDTVYRKPYPNRFLGSFSPFIHKHIGHPQMRALVADNFRSFIARNVMQYDYMRHKAHFVGSIAFFYKDILVQTAEEMGIQVGAVTQSPLPALTRYHAQAGQG